MSYEAIAESIKTLSYEQQIELMSIIVMSLKKHSSETESLPAGNHASEYPQGFFDNFGADPDFDIKEPEELPWNLDSTREAF